MIDVLLLKTLCRKRRPDDNEDDNYRPPRSKRIKKDQDIQEHHAIEVGTIADPSDSLLTIWNSFPSPQWQENHPRCPCECFLTGFAGFELEKGFKCCLKHGLTVQ
jgi:hypothetical protein